MVRFAIALMACGFGAGCLGSATPPDWAGYGELPEGTLLTHGYAYDFTIDGIDDVVVVSPSTDRVFLLKGVEGTGVSGYFNVLEISDPVAAFSEGVGGGDEPDILVLSSVDAGNDNLRALLTAYPDVEDDSAVQTPLTLQLPDGLVAPPVDGPAFFAARPDTSESSSGLTVFGHEVDVFVADILEWDAEFSQIPVQHVGLEDEWEATLGAEWSPGSTPADDDLVVATQNHVRWFANNGGTLDTAGVVNPFETDNMVLGAIPATEAVDFWDLDGDGTTDVVAVGSAFISAMIVAPDSAGTQYYLDADRDRSLGSDDGYLPESDGNYIDVAVAEFDDDGRDIIALEEPGNDGIAQVRVLMNVSPEAGVLYPDREVISRPLPAGFTPIFMVTGNFDGDCHTELLVMAADGASFTFDLETDFLGEMDSCSTPND